MTRRELKKWSIGEISLVDLKVNRQVLLNSRTLMKVTVDDSGLTTMVLFPYLDTFAEKVEYAQERIAEISKAYPEYVKTLLNVMRIDYYRKQIWSRLGKPRHFHKSGGWSKVSHDDIFSFDIGIYLYLSRALQLDINPSYFL